MGCNILVLLSTYNGERYLRQQLQSILDQNGVAVKILARDDGSKDTTLKILKEFSDSNPGFIDIIEGKNVGCKESFFQLIETASEKYPDFDYYAFADQDDVWLPEKLKAGIEALKKEDNEYRVYYCPPQLVDENLNCLPSNHVKAKGTLAEAFIIAPSLGCTMIFTPALLQKLNIACKHEIPCLHDALAYRLNLALGGAVIEDSTPHILYRQHSANVVGGMQSTQARWKRRLKWFYDADHQKSETAARILDIFDKELPPHEKSILADISGYRFSTTRKLRMLFSRKEYASNRLGHNIMFKTALLFNRI